MTAEALNTLKSLKNLAPSKGPDDFKKAAQKSQAFSNHLSANRPPVTSAASETKIDNEQLSSQNKNKNRQIDRQNKQDAQDQRLEKHQNDRRQDEATSRTKNERHSNSDPSERTANSKETSTAQETKNNKSDTQADENSADETKSTKEDEVIAKNTTEDANQDASSIEDQLATQTTNPLNEDLILSALHLNEQTTTIDDQNTLLSNQDQTQTDEQLSKQGLLAQNAPGQDKTALDQTTKSKAGQELAGQNLTGKFAGKTNLESTLGQDEQNLETPEHSEGQEKKNANFTKVLTQNTAQKDLTQSLSAQNPPANAPILASGQQAANTLLKTTALGTAHTDASLIQTLDGPDGVSGLNNNLDAKGNNPLTQVRTPGFTSPTQAIALSIAQKVQNGVQQFEIRLNPPELGRVEVRLEFGKDGQMATHLIVERPETLELLNKDSRQLERALSQAGINVENENLSFSLKDQQSDQNAQKDSLGTDPKSQNNASDKEETTTPTPIYQRITPPGTIDISI